MGNLSRRRFLYGALSTISYSSLNPKILAANQNQNINYIQINIAGGPSRWNFDNPIAPFTKSSFVPHPMIVNSFMNKGNSNLASSLSYKRTKVNGLLMPSFWNETTLTSKGIKNVSGLLDNALIIRGCHMRNDGHSLNNRKLSAPTPGSSSISGLLADKLSHHLFPAVNLVANSGIEAVAGGAFKSEQDSVQINTPQNSNNHLSYLLNPFIMNPSTSHRWKRLIQAELGQAIAKNYKKLLEKHSKRKKFYQEIIKNGLDPYQLYNIGERPTQGALLEKLKSGKIHQDFVKYLNYDYFIGNTDFRTILQNSKIENMADQFASAEILITEKLCGNITLNINTISNLFYENSFSATDIDREFLKNGSTQFFYSQKSKMLSGNNVKHSFQPDSHDTGLMPNLFLTQALFKAISGCLLEFKQILEKNSLFDKTLIHIASEFDRDPRPDCSGSEHGWNGHISSFYSGSIKGLKVIGNIYTKSPGESYYKDNGTWGQGAPIKENGNRPLVYGNIASSISNVLNIKSPSQNDKPLFEMKSGKINTLIDEAKNIDS